MQLARQKVCEIMNKVRMSMYDIQRQSRNKELTSKSVGGVWKFRYFKASAFHSCNDKTYRSKLL